MSCNAQAILFSVQRDRLNVFERNLNIPKLHTHSIIKFNVEKLPIDKCKNAFVKRRFF
jgi:hypothetical protein